jgi:hypothetical protein
MVEAKSNSFTDETSTRLFTSLPLIGGDQVSDKWWGIYGNGGLEACERNFAGLFDRKKTIIDVLKGQYRKGKQIVVVDYGAPTDAVSEIADAVPLDFGCAITLEDLRKKRQKSRDERNNITLLPANLLRPDTRRKLDLLLEGRKVTLGMEKLIAGWALFPTRKINIQDIRLRFLLLDEAYKRLDPDGGMLLFEFEGDLLPLLESYQQTLRKNHIGLRLGTEGNTLRVMKLVRHRNSPTRLPQPELSEREVGKLLKRKLE